MEDTVDVKAKLHEIR